LRTRVIEVLLAVAAMTFAINGWTEGRSCTNDDRLDRRFRKSEGRDGPLA
jgi:hypothetical protein